MLIGGCPKRQAQPRIVYTTPPPAAAAAPASTAPPQALVIEEPAPPTKAEQVSTPNAAQEKPARPRRRVARTEPPTSTEPSDANEAPETPEEPPPAAVPALEPRESSAQVSVLRPQIQSLQDDVRTRLSRINESKLSLEDRKTLEDARTFFAQSNRALQQGDLQRALLLARKASLLVAALEQ